MDNPVRDAFTTLPPDLHTELSGYLHASTLRDLCLTSRALNELYAPARKSKVTVQGGWEFGRFVKSIAGGKRAGSSGFWAGLELRMEDQERDREREREREEEGALEKTGNEKVEDGQIEEKGIADSRELAEGKNQSGVEIELPPSKGDLIRELELYEAGPNLARAVRGDGSGSVMWMSEKEELESLALEMEDELGGMLGAALVRCPNLQSFHVLQSPLPFTPSLSLALRAYTPHLHSLTFHTHHLDASALAFAIDGLPNLHTLDLSGVRTCWCRGLEEQVRGTRELANALARAGKLQRLVFTASKVLAVEDGVLLRSLAELARSSRIEDKDQNPVNNAASNDHDDTPGQFALRLTSFEVRRCGVKGLALCDFLASPACEELQHLFIGGCKRVRASHLEVAPTSFARGDRSKSDYGKKQPLGANLDPAPGKALPTGSTRPLELELDGRLLSTALLKRLGLRIVHLRIFEPAAVHLDLLIKALEKRRLPNLSELVVLPAEIDLDGWSEPSADTDLEETSPCGTPLEAVHSLDSDSTASSLCMPGNEESVKEPSALEDKAPTIGPECQDPRASRGRRNSVIGVQPSPQKGELRSRVLSALSCYECSTERGASEHERRRPSLKVGDNLWTSVRQRRMEMGWWNKIEAAAEAAKKAASDSEPGALQVLGGPWGLGELGNSGLGMWGTPVVENVLHAL